MTLELNNIKEKAENAIRKFLRNDSILLEIDVNERTMTYKLAEYIQEEFQGWNVDCEYNRDLEEKKRLSIPKGRPIQWDDLEAKTVFPYVIVHRRKTRENLLVIEAKKSTSRIPDHFDKSKLHQFVKRALLLQNGLVHTTPCRTRQRQGT